MCSTNICEAAISSSTLDLEPNLTRLWERDDNFEQARIARWFSKLTFVSTVSMGSIAHLTVVHKGHSGLHPFRFI